MARVLHCGVATVDFVFAVSSMPATAEKHRASDFTLVGGGCAATAAVATARLGGKAALAGRLGDDPIADLVLAELVAEGIDCAQLRRFPGARSACSSVFVDPAGERLIMNFRGALPDDAGWVDAAGADGVMADTRWPAGALAAFAQARAAGRPAVLDAEAPVDPDVARAASHVAFSTQGLAAFTGIGDRDAGLRAAAAALPGWVCVTDGGAGVFHIRDGAVACIPAPAVNVVDTLGAGDVWHGAFALRLAEGADEIAAARFANAAAALKCTVGGGRAGAPRRAAVEALMEGAVP